MLSLRLEASASIYDWIDPKRQTEPFGRGGAVILIDMTILVVTQMETWGDVGTPVENWSYEIRHYDQHLNLLGMVTTGVLPFEAYHCYFVPVGGYNALLMVADQSGDRTYRTAFVSASGAVPTISAFTVRTSANTTNFYWGRNSSRCQWVEAWNAIVMANGRESIHVFNPSGVEITYFNLPSEQIGSPLTWNLRRDDLYLSTYTTTAGYQLAEFRLTRVTFSSYTLTKMGDFCPEGPTGVPSFRLWGLGLGGASVDPRMVSWYGEYFPDPGGGFSSRFRWFNVADATTGELLDRKDMTIVGNFDTDFNNALSLYPVENFYGAVNTTVGETYFAGQLGGEQNFVENGVAGEYPSFAIHVIGLDPTTGEQRYLALPIPGVHGEQDTLSDGSVTFSIRNGQWVVTCCNVNLDNFIDHGFYSFSVWTGTTHSLTMWDGDEWRVLGNKFDTEYGRMNLQIGETEEDWVEEIREGEDVGESVVVPLLTTPGSFAAPWFATSASGYPQYTGWVTEASVAAYRTKIGGTPYIDQADHDLNYVAVSAPVDGSGNDIWVSTYWAPLVPSGTVVSAYVEFQIRGNGGSSDTRLHWGISGAQYYFSNYSTGSEQGTAFAKDVWRTHRMSLIDERFSAQTRAKFLADLTGGYLNAGVHMDRAFDVSAIRLVVQYAEETTRPLKMWIPDAVGTFAGWIEVIRMRFKGARKSRAITSGDPVGVTDSVSHTLSTVGGAPVVRFDTVGVSDQSITIVLAATAVLRTDLLAVTDSVAVVLAGSVALARADQVGITDSVNVVLTGSGGVDPEPGRLLSRQTVAVIGDDRVVSAGISNLRSVLVGQGYLDANVWIYAVNGKTTAGADSGGKTVSRNMAEARDYFGGDPDAWVVVVGSNSASGTVTSEMSEPLLAVQNNYDRRVSWLSATQSAFNSAAAPLVNAKKNSTFITTSTSTSSALISAVVAAVGPPTTGADGGWTKARLLTPPPRAGTTIVDGTRTWQTVRYEDTYVSGDTFQQTLNRVTGGKILTLPPGTFTITGFTNGYNDGVRIGSGGATGCIGIAGSGRSTIIRLTGSSATGGNIIGVDRLNAGPAYFGNFQLQSDDQACPGYAGIFIANSPASLVEWVYLNGAFKGYANYPPGETFGINFLNSNNCVLRDSEVDGRNRVTGARQGASPAGWNGSAGNYAQNARVERCYMHHGLAGMLTFWQTNNVTCDRYHGWSLGSGSGQLSGSQINLEEVTGAVRLNYCRLYAYGSYYKQTGWPGDPLATGNVDFAFAQASTIQDMTDVIVTEPRFDVAVNGLLSIVNYRGYQSSSGVFSKVVTQPRVTKNGRLLVGHNHTDSGWQASATLDNDFTWVR